jgi:hypothetical protein
VVQRIVLLALDDGGRPAHDQRQDLVLCANARGVRLQAGA